MEARLGLRRRGRTGGIILPSSIKAGGILVDSSHERRTRAYCWPCRLVDIVLFPGSRSRRLPSLVGTNQLPSGRYSSKDARPR